ncbi:MAG: UDP-2,3-diacylglucosamine diphosphatase [Rhodocyclaceae bacterium]|nr:UDP-2,3-diacylglucosamine diphosphatase [Rhodocyclaceae bacterium]
MPDLLISDLHLCPSRRDVTGAFLDFLEGRARQARALYILGDLFEYWVGDDCLESDAFGSGIVRALAGLVRSGVPGYLMVGNRDFLIGPAFARASGLTLLSDPTLIELSGVPTLLMHGDSLCSDDTAYQAFRALSRSPEWQSGFLSRPLTERHAMAEAYRRQSEEEKAGKASAIMDVNPEAVAQALRRHGYPRLIHGHTHRPARHEHEVDGRCCERWVLPDWKDRAVWLECGAEGCVKEAG